MSRYYIALERVEKAVIAVRVSGGHLCEAEAPTEPAGETAARRAAIRFPHSSSLRTPSGVWQSVSLLKGITDSFTLCVQNDITLSYCENVRRVHVLSLT